MKNLKKILSVLALIVLLGSDVLTSISYALNDILEDSVVVQTENEEEAENVENVEENIEENGEDAYEDESIEEEELETENSAGDIVEEGTGEVSEIGSGEVEELTEETVEGAIGDIIEGVTGDIAEELTGEVVESIEIGEKTVIEEITYNEEPITGEKTYNDVTVRVEALSGIFPEGTELTIKPIKWWNLSSLKDKLVEEIEEIKEDTTIVAFDITFKYEGEEVQPKDGEKVKVTFDYSNNEDLVKADKNENQEVKVYHIEDKDEEGNKVAQGEEKIVDVTNNEESKEEGIVVAEAESFSIYALSLSKEDTLRLLDTVTVTHNPNAGVSYTLNGNENFTAGTITITDGTNTITMLDSNLGATAGVGCKGNCSSSDPTYGYYFQWGNNYGFDPKSTRSKSNTQVQASSLSYDPLNQQYFSSNTFINVGDTNWLDDNSVVDLWGGSVNDKSLSYPLTQSDAAKRRGPCPENFHVPSYGELNQIVSMMGDGVENTRSELLIPFAGKTDGFGMDSMGDCTYLWSSSPYVESYYPTTKKSHIFFMCVGSNVPTMYTFARALAFPVRCFYDFYEPYTSSWQEGYNVRFDANRGTFDDTPAAQNNLPAGSHVVEPQTHPELNGYTFIGWFTEAKGGREWDFADDVVTQDMTLYAHWAYDYAYGDLDVYIVDGNGDVSTYVMMDRNVGASEVYNQNFDEQNFNSFGFIYQWGNNWGFNRCQGEGSTCHGDNTLNPLTSGIQVPRATWEKYMPSKYASKTWNTFKSGTEDSVWQAESSNQDNLWGYADGYDEQQGPCPDGYHVPEKTIFNEIILGWAQLKGYNITANDGFQDAKIADFTHDFLFPLAGTHRKGLLEDTEQGDCAEYWTSGPSTIKNSENIFFCKIGKNEYYDGKGLKKYNQNGSSVRNNGSTVRCFKNIDTTNLTINPDKGKGALITVDKVDGVNTIIALIEPSRSQAGLGDLKFEGWYTDPDFIEETYKTGGSILSANETALYAKWSCPQEGYEYDGVSCVSVPYSSITFDANGGSFNVDGGSQNTQTKSLVYGTIYDYSDLPTPTRPGFVFSGWYAEFNGVDDYVDYGVGFRFDDKISIHVSAYMENWSEFDVDNQNGDRIISCTIGDNGGWAIKTKNGKMQFACMDNKSWKSATSTNMSWSNLTSGWHDFDVVFDGQNARLFLDNSSQAIATSDNFSSGKLTYDSNTSISAGAQPGKSGTNFKGKIKDVIIQHSDQIITSTDVLLVPNQDVTYYALWEEVDGYTLTFDSMGGSDVPSQVVKSGATGVRPVDPTKTGYVFSGWFLDGATEEFDFTGTQITGNITLYAHWNTGVSEFTVNCYKKVLDVDHNVLENESYSYLTGIVITGATADEITVADYAYKCVTDATEGYEYTGAIVYSSEDESGTKKETATILLDGSMKIDMFFQPVQNQFTLNPATHTSTAGSSQNGLYYYGAKVTLNGDSNDDCFEWDEWNGFPEGFENSKQTYFYMPNSAVSVTPSVTQNTYNIIFSGNGSTSGTMLPMNGLDCSESKPLTINNFEKSGHSFSGWSETEDGAKKYENNESVSRLSTIDKDDVFLYAVWDVDQYDVNVSVETGQENMGYLSGNTSTGVSLTGLYNYATELVFIAVPELGYVFDYWMDLDAGEQISGEEIEGGKNKLEIVVEGIMNIIAFFKPAENTPYIVEHYKQNLSQDGYEFAWSGTMYGTTNELTNATGSDYEGFTLSGDLASYQRGIKADGSTVVRLYYDRDTYTVTWNMWEGHSGWTIKKFGVIYGSQPVFEWDDEDKYTPKRGRDVYTDDIKYDFIFTGWVKDGSAEIIKDLTTQIVTGNVTYTAQYDTGYRYYEVRYHTDEGTGTMVPQSLQLYSSGTLTKNTFTKTGYDFSGWWYEYGDGIEVFYEDEQEINLGVEDDVIKSDAEWEDPLYLDLYAQWKASSGTKVTVNYYLKNLDADNNVLIDTITEYATGVEFTGNTDDVVDILSRYGTGIEGYEYSKSIVYGSDLDEYGIETGTTTILADGSRVIDMYYVPIQNQFTLNSATHTSTAGSSQSGLYYYGAKVTLSGDSSDDCFSWSGWNGLPELVENSKQTEFYMPVNAVTVSSSAKEKTYNIIFNGNESTSGMMSPMNGVRCTESTGLTLNAFEKEGHTFSGWLMNVGGEKHYSNGQTVSRLSKVDGDDVNLYAEWNINSYNVTGIVTEGQENMGYLSGNISTGASLTGLYDYGTKLVFVAIPEFGYLFDYWEVNGFTGESLPEGITVSENQLTIVVNQILNIVAHFKPDIKTVTVNHFQENIGGGYTLHETENNFTGYVDNEFVASEKEYSGFVASGNNNKTIIISGDDNSNVINLYYERNKPHLQVSIGNGTNVQISPSCIGSSNYYNCEYYYDEEISISVVGGYEEGYSYSGWYNDQEYPLPIGTQLDENGTSFKMPNNDVHLYLDITHNLYKLTFTGYEGTDISNVDTVDVDLTGENYFRFNEEIELPYLNKPGYNFVGWNSGDYNEWGVAYTLEPYHPIWHMPSHDVELTAEFTGRTDMEYYKYYYFQKTEGSGYVLSGDERFDDGITDQRVSSNCKYVEGFTHSRGEPDILYIKATGDNYINCYYDRDEYWVDVIYDNNKLSIVGTGKYRYEAPVNLIATANTGYEFSGFSSEWPEYNTTGSTLSFNVPLGGPYSIYADANPIEYSIEYELDGGRYNPSWYENPTTYTIENPDIPLLNPEKDGYKFLGWTGGIVSGGIEGEEDIVVPTRDLVITGGSIGDRKYYANWEPDEVKVTVNYYLKKLNTGDNVLIDDVDIYREGVIFTGIADRMVNISGTYLTGIVGYHYDHATVFSGGERIGATETTVLPDGSREINMYYIPNKYNFTLNSDSYSSTEGSSESTGYYYGATVRLSGDSNNDCYSWSGWTINGITLSDSTSHQTWFAMPANDVDVTPSTTEKTYNIIFNGNGSTLGEMSSMIGVRCTESTGLTLNSFGKNGYTFTGWSTTSGDNIREYIDGQAVSGLSMNNGENVNLYAVWNIDWYTVTFDLNGGSLTGDMTLTTGYTIETSIISLEKYIPVKSGYTLIGWYRDDTLVDHIAGGETGDYILIAHWKADSDTLYTVKYYKENLNGGYDVWTGIYTGETDIEVTALVKDFTGFTYSGGNENNVTTGVVVGDGSLVLKLYYDRNKYTIIWKDGNDEILKSENLFYETIPEYIGNTPTKTKTQQYTYTFNGTWLPNIESVTTGATYVAQFDETVNSYTINIVPNDTDMGTISTGEIDVSYGSVIVESGNIITIGGIEIEAIPNLADVQYTYEFDNWTNTCGSELVGTCTIQANFKKTLNKYPITWKNDDGSLIDTTMVEYGATPTHANPTKSETEDYRYVFAGWDPEVVAVVGDAEYTAVFNAEEKEKSSKGGGMSGGGGRGGNIDNSDNQHGSAEENIDGSGYTGDEVVEVDDTNKDIVPLYKWTYENNVTTMDTLEDADPDGLLTRGHLAKMVVNYMVNVLGRSMPYDVTYNCLYRGDDESSWESDEIRDYATKACAFGVMGINMEDNKFLPNSIVTRAEFGTVMSRVLWGDKYNITDTDHRSYYENHLQALKKDSLLTQIANPETRWEIRKWVWLVFRRIVEKYKK